MMSSFKVSDICSSNIEEAFDQLANTLSKTNCNLVNNCVRTWIYLKDIGKDYKKMITGRATVLHKYGLSRYIVSTGVQCPAKNDHYPVLMDAYIIEGLTRDRTHYLSDLSRICHPEEYGATFERGIRISHKECREFLISGTASINSKGSSVFVGSVEDQLDKTLDNIYSLLRSGGANLKNVTEMTVYLKDKGDRGKVQEVLSKYVTVVPVVYGDCIMCRPELLVEIECRAVMQGA